MHNPAVNMPQAPFDADVLRRFRRLWLMARRGGGIADRLEHRDYTPGDDYRGIDWRLCARRDELLSRIGGGDRDVPAYVLLDCSASMAIGGPPKFRLARVVAAMAAYRALADGRCCGLSAFAVRAVSDLPAVRGLLRMGRVLRFLEDLSPKGDETDLARAAEEFVRRYQPHGTAIVITDCHDRTGYARGLQILAARGYDPKLVHLYAPCEADPGLLGDVELFDVESRLSRWAVVTERTAARYRQHFSRFRDSIRDECSRRGIACLQAAGDAPEDVVLQSVLRSEFSFS
jgi:uncharacterized protein (DUF58 family)